MPVVTVQQGTYPLKVGQKMRISVAQLMSNGQIQPYVVTNGPTDITWTVDQPTRLQVLEMSFDRTQATVLGGPSTGTVVLQVGINSDSNQVVQYTFTVSAVSAPTLNRPVGADAPVPPAAILGVSPTG